MRNMSRYVPEEVYPNEMYPQFLCGVGYLMSIDVAIRLYEESFKHELFFIEDVFITGKQVLLNNYVC